MMTANAYGTTCEWCGMIHQSLCPRIKAIEYEGGMVKRIEFHGPLPLNAAPALPATTWMLTGRANSHGEWGVKSEGNWVHSNPTALTAARTS